MPNPLFPVFLKLDRLKVMIVGGGEVALEKLFFLFKSSPNANVTVIAPELKPKTKAFIDQLNNNITVINREFQENDPANFDIVIAATNIKEVNLRVFEQVKKHGKIINVADTPELCDFYMGSIVTKGNLKIGISTNGKSPTLAKRVREMLEATFPDETDELLNNLSIYRDQLSGDFEHKVKELNRITQTLIKDQN